MRSGICGGSGKCWTWVGGLVVAVVLASCSPAVPRLSPGATIGSAMPTSTLPQPLATPAIQANGDGCPGPREALDTKHFQSYGDARCFRAGATVTGWWQRQPDGSITLGQRVGSVGARAAPDATVAVQLQGGQTLPADGGYGAFYTTTVGSDLQSIDDAVVTPLTNPATACPAVTPIPVGVFLESLTDCYTPGVNVTISGWRGTLAGLCGCGSGEVEKPAWLTGGYGFGWLFAEPYSDPVGAWLTLYAPKVAVLGGDSGVRPTWMEVTGHFDDSAATTCHVVGGTAAQTTLLRAQCATRFVVTTLRELPPPPSTLSSVCPTGNPYHVADVAASRLGAPLMERLCFAGRDVPVAGWFDPAPVFPGSTVDSTPTWLDVADRPGLRPTMASTATGDTWLGLFLFTNPATSLVLPDDPGWYVMTGHFDDPAAMTCVRTDGLNAGMDWSEMCRSEFVVTGVEPL
jgi:hypothetical protein